MSDQNNNQQAPQQQQAPPVENVEKKPEAQENAPAPAPVETAVHVDPDHYQGVPLGGLRGTNFIYKLFMLVVVQYFLSTWGIWLANGDVLSDEFKEAYHNHYVGIISITLLVLLWLGCYFLQYLPASAQNKEAFWWWIVYAVYILVFAYSAGYVSANAVLDVNFLFNLYLLTSFTGVFFYALVCHMLQWYIRTGYMFICAILFNYVSWTFMHYAHITDAGFAVNLATAGAAGLLVILGIVFTAVVLEDGFRYKENEFVYAACVFLVETFVVIFSLFRALYVEPRKPFLKRDPENEPLAKNVENPQNEASAPPAPAS